jgi:Alpha-L-fucosidase.
MKERKQLLGIFLIISALFNVQSHKAQNKKDTNDYFGIRKNWEVMNHSKTNAVKVFNEDKYGMFIHFGLYSQLAGEYQGKKIEEGSGARIAEWIQFALEIPRKDYAAVAKDF